MSYPLASSNIFSLPLAFFSSLNMISFGLHFRWFHVECSLSFIDLHLLSIINLGENSVIVTCIFYLFYFIFLAALGLHCCAQAFSSCGERGLLFVVVHRLLIVVASLVAEQGSRCAGFSSCGTQALERRLSSCGARGLSCSMACGIFPDQGWNPCPLHWQVDS